jgi:asparagine synthase (glutamine-hydrolysing)
LKAFNCGFDVETHDERAYARLTAAKLGIELHEIVMDWNCLRAGLAEFVEWFDEPFFDYSAIAVHMLCREARKHGVKVLLGGDGADELFAGYRWYDDFATACAGGLPDPLGYFHAFNGFFARNSLSALVGHEVDFDHVDLLRRFDRPDLPPVSRGQWLDFHTFLVDDVLTKVDRASMAAGVEVRVPFLDQKLLDEAFLWPQEFLYHGGERKYALKKALGRWVPESILTRRKKGFGFPLEAWESSIRGLAKELLPRGQLVAQGFACSAGMEEALQRLNVHAVWLLLVAELWARRFVANEDIGALIESLDQA